MSAVEISNVTRSFSSVTAVDQLSLSVPEGSVYGFIGSNGSGKSTTMRMIANIFYPDTGTIRVFGHAPSGTRSGEVGYLPEERGVYRKMRQSRTSTIRRHIRKCFWLRWHNTAGRRNALSRLGIREPMLKLAASKRGAWRMAANHAVQTALTNATLRRCGFLMPSDLAAR